jgi:hypothetical protein
MAEFESNTVSTEEKDISNNLENVSLSINHCIAEDHQFVRDFLPPAAVETMTKDCLTVIIIRTAYARVQLRFLYSQDYPTVPPIIEISSPTLPLPLLRNKERECLDLCKQHPGKAQFKIVYEQIYQFIHSNMFIPCWKELKQVATLCEGKGKLGMDEKEGVLQMILSCGRYKQNFKLKVPYNYPEEGVQIEFVSSNFPLDVQISFKSQAEELVRRFEAGFTPEQALAAGQSGVKLPTKATESKIKITTESLKNIKHDVAVLKQISDLRAATGAHDSKKYYTQVNAERKEARKDLRRLARAETEKEQELQKQLLEEEQSEMKELLKQSVSETAQPSLYQTARYLIDDYIFKLPVEKCQACKGLAFNVDPEHESNKNPRSERRAMRTYCGHYLHWNCLNDWLTSPPFVRQCPICNRRIWHPDWPEDYKQLEKAWQSKEARKREVSDVSDFMGMGSEFSK